MGGANSMRKRQQLARHIILWDGLLVSFLFFVFFCSTILALMWNVQDAS